MPLARLVLILILVVAAAVITVWLGALVAAAVQHPAVSLMVAIPFALAAYILVRVVWDRTRSGEDGHYDRIDK